MPRPAQEKKYIVKYEGNEKAVATRLQIFNDPRKREVAVLYLAFQGDVPKVIEAAKISPNVLYKFIKSAWWPNLIEDIKKQEKLQLSGKLKEVIAESLILLQDRIKNGNIRYDMGSGIHSRVPLSSKEATEIFSKVFDRKEILDKSEGEGESNIRNRMGRDKLTNYLKEIATKMLENSKGSKKEAKKETAVIIEGEFTNV